MIFKVFLFSPPFFILMKVILRQCGTFPVISKQFCIKYSLPFSYDKYAKRWKSRVNAWITKKCINFMPPHAFTLMANIDFLFNCWACCASLASVFFFLLRLSQQFFCCLSPLKIMFFRSVRMLFENFSTMFHPCFWSNHGASCMKNHIYRREIKRHGICLFILRFIFINFIIFTHLDNVRGASSKTKGELEERTGNK